MEKVVEKIINANIYSHKEWVKDIDPTSLQIHYKSLLISSGFKIVNYSEHYFPNKGFTCVWLLAESHLAIHTFPNANKSYIELSSCNKAYLDKFIHLNKS